MTQTRAKPSSHAQPSLRLQRLLRAEILEVVDDDTVLVRSVRSSAQEVLEVEIAVVGYLPVVGDRVVVEQGDDAWFVVGALGAARRRQVSTAAQLMARAGLTATFDETGGIELRASQGDLTFAASSRIVFRAGTDVRIEAAGRTELQSNVTSISTERLETSANEMMTQAGRIEIQATRIVESADDVYRHVDGLAQLQAGRVRTLVDGAYQLVAKRTSITSDEDTIVDGKRVLLG